MTDLEAYEHWFATTSGTRFGFDAWQEGARLEREACIAAIEALRDAHCAGTQTAELKIDRCEPDDQYCEFVVAWNDAAQAIRARSAVADTLEK